MKRIYISLLLMFIFVYTGCDPKQQPDASTEGKLRVVTTIGMITDIVKNVGGERVEVTGLMGPGVDPHLYKASAGDVHRLTSAQIIFFNGLHLESKMGDILAKMTGNTKTVAVTDAVDRNLLLTPPEFEGQYDPHVWFDVTLWMRAVGKVRDTLSEYDSDNTLMYWSNAERYLAKLAELHEYVKAQSERVPSEQRVLVTAHDAFTISGRLMGLRCAGYWVLAPQQRQVLLMSRNWPTFIAERRIPAIFVESSVSSRSLTAVQAAVNSKGVDVKIGGELFSDAMGNEGTPEGTYIGMVRHNMIRL